MKRLLLFALLALLCCAANLTAIAQTEAMVARFLRAFAANQSFAAVEEHFFHVTDLDDLLAALRADLLGKGANPLLDKFMNEFAAPEARPKLETEIQKGLAESRQKWEQMLQYPADPGTDLKVAKLNLEIRYSPFRIYEIEIHGTYTSKGQPQSFRIRAEYFILNGRVRITRLR
jgi:hypothetical protein